MPIDYNHPDRISYDHPRRRKQGSGADAGAATPPPAPAPPPPPTPTPNRRAGRGLVAPAQPQNRPPQVAPRLPAPPQQAPPQHRPPQPPPAATQQQTTASGASMVVCACGQSNDRSLVAQCTSCGSDLWTVGGGSAEPARSVPRRSNLPDEEPERLETGFIDAMENYSAGLRDRMNSMLELPGTVADRRIKEIAAAIYAQHLWDPTSIHIEVMRINLMKLKISEWAERGGNVPVDQIGWSKVLTFVEELGTMKLGADRDWSSGDIELQHAQAIPVRYDYLEGVRRLSTMLGDYEIEPLELMSRLLNLFNAFIEDFGRRNNHPLEILTGDMSSAITARPGWEPEWAFVWPTYHGMVGVYAYNDWVAQSPQLEWTLASMLLKEA